MRHRLPLLAPTIVFSRVQLGCLPGLVPSTSLHSFGTVYAFSRLAYPFHVIALNFDTISACYDWPRVVNWVLFFGQSLENRSKIVTDACLSGVCIFVVLL